MKTSTPGGVGCRGYWKSCYNKDGYIDKERHRLFILSSISVWLWLFVCTSGDKTGPVRMEIHPGKSLPAPSCLLQESNFNARHFSLSGIHAIIFFVLSPLCTLLIVLIFCFLFSPSCLSLEAAEPASPPMVRNCSGWNFYSSLKSAKRVKRQCKEKENSHLCDLPLIEHPSGNLYLLLAKPRLTGILLKIKSHLFLGLERMIERSGY